ncbi:MAG: hypothetical protein K0S61_150 [Anaerocolumna sp.]|jgi:hypothetical protein|nr:hypothetical protein [Anaerocolumna sp.]
MDQLEFVKLSIGDKVLTVCKGNIVEMKINSIMDNGRRKKCVILNNPDKEHQILRHMYSIYPLPIIKAFIKE